MWAETTQPQYRRAGLRHASGVSDQEWAQIEALLPLPKKLGRPRTTAMREAVNARLYRLTTGCQWRLLPKEFPPFSTVQRFFYRWRDAGLWRTIKWQQISVSPADAELLASRRFSTEELARIYQVPPPLAGIWDHSSFTNSETAGRWFAQYTLRRHG